MYIMGTTDYPVMRPEVKGTLWHCEKCESLVSIHCAKVFQEAFCPTCGDVPLEFCGTFDSILGRRFADA
jgi:uncharacterized paraquat-inducible protein A